MKFSSVHMVSETIGWAAGAPEGQRDFMGADIKGCIFHTTDGGYHWETVKTWNSDITAFFLSQATVWVVSKDHLAHTSDAGTTWEEFALPFAADDSATITHLTFLDARNCWFIAQIHHASAPPKSAPLVALYHTNNGGTHWTQLLRKSEESPSFPRMSNGITFLTAATGWMTSGSSLFMTHDGGRTWQPQTLPLPAGVQSFSGFRLQTPRFFSAQNGILSACRSDHLDSAPKGFVIFVTHDGGQSWQSQPFVYKDYNHVYAKKHQEIEEKKMKEAKSGETLYMIRSLIYWVTPAPEFTDMQFGWIGHPSLEISITRDGGEHWEELPTLPKECRGIQFLNSQVGWSWSHSNGSFFLQLCHKTTDGGKTWAQLIPAIN